MPFRSVTLARVATCAFVSLYTLTAAGCSPPSESAAPAVTNLVSGDTALESAARRVVAFLRGNEPFDGSLFADTVLLLLPAEAGSASRRVPVAELAERSTWRAGDYRFLPPDGPAVLEVRAGTHFRCWATPLAATEPALAGSMHVGVLLRPAQQESCLASWNTLLFDSAASAPRISGVLYDQWEW
jgi:hypothetical protein